VAVLGVISPLGTTKALAVARQQKVQLLVLQVMYIQLQLVLVVLELLVQMLVVTVLTALLQEQV